jgi:hypothetical protein
MPDAIADTKLVSEDDNGVVLQAFLPPSSSKYSSLVAEFLWALTLDSGQDEDAGSSTDGDGWYGLFRGPFTEAELPRLAKGHKITLSREAFQDLTRRAGFIVSEDTQGFVSLQTFADKIELERRWEEICEDGRIGGQS